MIVFCPRKTISYHQDWVRTSSIPPQQGLRSPIAGKLGLVQDLVDFVDVGLVFRGAISAKVPLEAFEAFRSFWKGRREVGLETLEKLKSCRLCRIRSFPEVISKAPVDYLYFQLLRPPKWREPDKSQKKLSIL